MKVDCLAKLLKQTGYDQQKSKFLVDGFTNGFDLMYQGPYDRQDRSKNILLRPHIGNATDLWEKMIKEVDSSDLQGHWKKSHGTIMSNPQLD